MKSLIRAPASPAIGHEPSWEFLLRSHGEEAHLRIHLVGIGGAGLSAVARVLLQRGYRVSGSDQRDSVVLAELANQGAAIFIGHRVEHADGAHLVLISSAVDPAVNPEVQEARRRGIPVVKREQFLEPLLTDHMSICVAGTHGKTTTSAMIATLLDAVGAEPGFIVGSQILGLGTNARAGRPGGPFVLEADEYDRTFLGLRPDIAVVTNVEWDHVDCYPTPAAYMEAFAQFVDQVPAPGHIVFCSDDAGAWELYERAYQPGSGRQWVAYGLEARQHEQLKSFWTAFDLEPTAGGMEFSVRRDGLLVGRASLPLPGEHNVRNALAALAAADSAGYVFTKAHENLKILTKMAGTSRRLEHKGESYGIIVLDDYAHHPTEVQATLSAARQRYPRRALWALFQPHTYSRTRALLSEFCKSFENADHVLITDIYAAREHDTMGVSAVELVASLESHPDARYAGSLQAATETLTAELQPGDVLLTMGAGDSFRVGEQVLQRLRNREAVPAVTVAARSMALAAAINSETGLLVRREEVLAGHTTMRVGGPAELLVTVSRLEELTAVARLARRFAVPLFVLGGGSNVLVSDQGIRGLVIANGCRAVRRHEGNVVWAESGANLAGLARQALRWGLSGLEWAVSVPGTVGGAVVGNAGAHGGSVADNLLRATLLTPDQALAEWPARRFHFAYRHSTLKDLLRQGGPAPVVLSAAFQLEPGDVEEMETRAAAFLAHRRTTQPVEASAGSIFQNPPGDHAGRILDSLGFKGRSHGGAAFSSVHANFIVNQGGARAADVVALIDEARAAAWEGQGVTLTPEILFVGDWVHQPPYAQLPQPSSPSPSQDEGGEWLLGQEQAP